MTVPIQERVQNHAIKAARTQLRMSQSEFAAAVRRAGATLGEPNDCTKRLVQKWESGEHRDCRPHYQRALQLATRTPFGELGFGGTSAVLSVVVPSSTANREEMPVSLPLTASSVASALEPADRLRLALERPAHVDGETVRVAQAEMERLFALEQHRPASSIGEAVNRHTVDVARQLAGTRSAVARRRLASIGGASAALAGWLALERGDASAAHRAWEGALAAANYTGDGPVLACVHGYLSYSAAMRGDPALAWQLAHSALEHAGSDVRARAWLTARTAQEAARLGDRGAALAAVDSVRKLGWNLVAARPGELSASWVRFVDAAYLAGMVAGVYGQLGETDLAQDAARHATRVLGTGRSKARALVLAEVACAAARGDALDFVERTALEAADLAENLEAVLACRKLRAVVAALRQHPTSARLQLAQKLAAQLDTWQDGASTGA